MCSIAIKIPDEVLYDTKMTKDEANAFISSVKNAITKIQSNGFYINENIIKLALKQAGEL